MLSRMAKLPVEIPSGVEVTVSGAKVVVKGPLGQLEYNFNPAVKITKQDDKLVLEVTDSSKFAKAMSGTAKALLTNMVLGVTKGFSKKLTLLGVGYKAQAQGEKLNLALGYSHPVVYDIPQGIKIKTPTPTEILVEGADKELVGHVAALIRGYRPVEPYKGKGVRYANEAVILKETKKK
jgi:large subunit ribosomal protein L6